ncbi:MAG: A1 family peptidase [Colwellia sp.]|nr:A1 family peptidase [Colwellia sp.]MCW9082146.1 A1 family peptidase [Colwellia sp.]
MALKLPITNVYAKGDYSAVLHLGSQQTPVNLILDTGSSTLVIKEESYQATKDKHLVATAIAQEVNYGIGGWNGPVVHSTVSIANHNQESITLENATFALVSNKDQFATFGKADGFIGLAYHHLNKGFNLSNYLTEQKVAPAHTYPWPFNSSNNEALEDSSNLATFKHFLWQYPEHDITPYFTDLALHNLSANKFSFYSKRSAIHMNDTSLTTTSTDTLKQDPLNQGWLILGGGEEQTDLYQGEFSHIKVEHDVYYNVELVSVQVGDKAPITAAPLQQDKVKSYLTNAIIDTGAGGIVLTADIYQQMIKDLTAINPEFETLLSPFKDIAYQEVGIDSSELNLAQWPDIIFTFVSDIIDGKKKTVQLTCTPQTYWQVNTPSFGKACFRFLSQLPQWPNQSIIGLPLLNNYYVIFDRSVDTTGVIKFAKQK